MPETQIVTEKILNGIDTYIQDQNTQPIDNYFTKSISSFTLSADTVASGKGASSLVYDLDVTSGHGAIATNEIIIIDTVSERVLYAVIISATATTLTLDRPIDAIYPALTTLARIVTTNMAVNGSVTPQIFSIRGGFVPADIIRMILVITDSTAMDDGKFGGIAALSNGVVFRIINSFQKTIFNFKRNADFKQFAYDGAYQNGVSGPSGTESFTTRITFNGQDKHGVVLRIGEDDVLQMVIQDDLTDLVTFRGVVQGHLTSGE